MVRIMFALFIAGIRGTSAAHHRIGGAGKKPSASTIDPICGDSRTVSDRDAPRTETGETMQTRRLPSIACASGALVLAALPLVAPSADAADHLDAPMAAADSAADITDFFAWYDPDGDRIVAAIAFAGLSEGGLPATYDGAVLYGIHVDNDGDAVADHDVWIRFGQNAAGDWGLQVTNLPGATDEVTGPVDTVVDAGLNLRVFAGLRDDPFFFDFDGFQMTLATGDLSFDSRRDSFRMTNATMIVVEMSVDATAAGSDEVQVWATTARK